MDLFALKRRTKERDGTIFGISPVSMMGIPDVLSSEEAAGDMVNRNLTDTLVLIVDDDARIKEERLIATADLEAATITNEQQIADMKAATERRILALESATNAYVINIDRYINSIKALLMSAKEYALAVERKKIALGLLKAEIAEEKGAIKIARIDMQIKLEVLNRKFVEIEVLRAELNLAKADVRMIMTQIDMEEAELAVIQARVDKAIMAVDRVKLEADIALIFADIATRELTKTEYDVDSAEITAGFLWVTDKLDSLLAILEQRQLQVVEKNKLQTALLANEPIQHAAEIDSVDIGLEQAQSDATVQEYRKIQTEILIAIESGLKNVLHAANFRHNSLGLSKTLQRDEAALAAEAIVKKYESSASTDTVSVSTSRSTITQIIS